MRTRTFRSEATVAVVLVVFFVISQRLWGDSSLEAWKKNEDSAAAASKAAHFADAERLLLQNQKLAETFPSKDARLPRTLFDLAQVYRAEGKYAESLPLYQRALQIYTTLYGSQSEELAQTLNAQAELYKSLGDYGHAEPLMITALEMRRKIP